MLKTKEKIQTLLDKAGITLNGPNPWDPQIHNEKLYQRVLLGGSLALGDSYVEGWWDVKNLDQFFCKIFSVDLGGEFSFALPNVVSSLQAVAFNLQSMSRAFQVGQQHYDIGNDIYTAMLGKSMMYSCAYWDKADNLDDAQFAKLDLICKKIGLKKGDTVLDIGCGWGGFLKFAVEKYGVKGVGITVSKEQKKLAEEWCKGLPIEFKLEDYRKFKGTFDHVISIGMFEHVGMKNYRKFMEKAHEFLKDGGLFLLHTIGGNRSSIANDPWIEKYIFPNGMLPSVAQIGKSVEGLFVMEDWHNFGADYDKTLMAWYDNFVTAFGGIPSEGGKKAVPDLREKYGETFYRMWKYYLLSCAGNFRARKVQLWQVVLSKKGVKGGYKTVR